MKSKIVLANNYNVYLTANDSVELRGLTRGEVWHCGRMLKYTGVSKFKIKIHKDSHSVKDMDMLLKYPIRNIDHISFPKESYMVQRDWKGEYYVLTGTDSDYDFEFFFTQAEAEKLPYKLKKGILLGSASKDVFKSDGKLNKPLLERIFPEELIKKRRVCESERNIYT